MLENSQVSTASMTFEAGRNASPTHSWEYRIWFRVIEELLWDYAHYRREFWTGKMKKTRYKKYRMARCAVFASDGALSDIVRAVATDAQYLLKHTRAAVSDEQIRAGYVLGRKMREDDPAKNKGGRPAGR